MINTKHLVMVGMTWTSTLYVVCFGGVAIFPPIREQFMRYALHTDISTGSNVMTIGTFFSGLILWNVIAALSLGLFAILSKKIKS